MSNNIESKYIYNRIYPKFLRKINTKYITKEKISFSKEGTT